MCCVTLLRQFNNKDVGVLEGERRSLYRMHRAAVTSTALAAHDEAQEDEDLDEEFAAIKCEDSNGSSSEEDEGEDDDEMWYFGVFGNFGHRLSVITYLKIYAKSYYF